MAACQILFRADALSIYGYLPFHNVHGVCAPRFGQANRKHESTQRT
jgi:hypothetical protein